MQKQLVKKVVMQLKEGRYMEGFGGSKGKGAVS